MNIIEEYQSKLSLLSELSLRGEDSRLKTTVDELVRLRTLIGYVAIKQGSFSCRVLNIPGRVEDIKRKLLNANKLQTGKQYFDKQYRNQNRTQASPAEARSILSRLIDEGTMKEDFNE